MPLATKWLYRIAQGFSPGYDRHRGCALPVRHSFGNAGRRRKRAPEQESERVRRVCDDPGFERDVWRGTHTDVRTTLSVALSGRISFGPQPRAKALGYSVVPLRSDRVSPRRPFAPFAAPHHKVSRNREKVKNYRVSAPGCRPEVGG